MDITYLSIPLLNLLPKPILTDLILLLIIVLLYMINKYNKLSKKYNSLAGNKILPIKPEDKPAIDIEPPIFSFIDAKALVLPISITNRALTKITIMKIEFYVGGKVFKTPITIQKSLYFQELMYAEAKKRNIKDDGPELMKLMTEFRKIFDKVIELNNLLFLPLVIEKGGSAAGHLILDASDYNEKQFVDDVMNAKGKVKLVIYAGESKKDFVYKTTFIPAN